MRILFISQYFPPEMGAPAARTYELALRWVAEAPGHRRTAIPTHPTGVIQKRTGTRASSRARRPEFVSLRTWIYPAAKPRLLARSLNYVSFMLSSLVSRLALRRSERCRHRHLAAVSGRHLGLDREPLARCAIRLRSARLVAGLDRRSRRAARRVVVAGAAPVGDGPVPPSRTGRWRGAIDTRRAGTPRHRPRKDRHHPERGRWSGVPRHGEIQREFARISASSQVRRPPTSPPTAWRTAWKRSSECATGCATIPTRVPGRGRGRGKDH